MKKMASKEVPLKSIGVSVRIVGTVAEVDSSLSYYNEEDAPVEATFTFPVDDGSAVYKFVADVNGRKIVAEIQEKEQAQLTYEDSLAGGKVAALLKQDDKSPDIFKCMLGNLPPKSEASLTLSYVIELPQEADGQLRFTLPTILNPRYSPDAGSLAAAEGATYVPPCSVPYSFSYTANVQGYHKVESVTSDGCSLKVEMEENNHVAKVTLAEEFKFDHDLFMMVKYEDCFTPQVVMEMGNSESEGMFTEDLLMLSFRPELKEVAIAESGEYVFVIDCSGSMGGDKIKNASEALLLFLKSLPTDCYFNVITFGSSFKSLFSSGSKKYTEATLKEAIKLQEKLSSNMGGTEILRPLQHIYKQKAIKGHDQNLFLLTDGEVNNTQAVIGLVKENAGSVRVFTLGIGEGASTALVSGIARAGNGKAEFIKDDSRVQPKVVSLLKCAMQPACTSIEVSWDLPPGVTPITIPAEMPTMITAGERFTVFAIMQGVDFDTIYGASSVTLKGQIGGQPVSYTLTFTLADDVKSSSLTAPAHRLAAVKQIKQLEDKEAADISSTMDSYGRSGDVDLTGLRNKVISLSRYANVISKWTAFVAVDQEGETVQGTMVERPCPVPTLSQEFLNTYYRREQMLCCGILDIDRGVPLCSVSNAVVFQSSSRKAKKGGGGLMSLFGCAAKKKKRSNKKLASVPDCPIEKPRTSDVIMDDEDEMFAIETDAVDKEAITLTLDSEDKEAMDTQSTPDKDDSSLLAVIRNQQLQGNWMLNESLAKHLELSVTQIKDAVPIKNESVACTLTVVNWLDKYWMSRQEEWQIIKTKALAWLEKQSLETYSVEDLLDICRNNLWPVD